MLMRTALTLETLAAIRIQIRHTTINAGVAPDRADLFVVAVHEGMMNALVHGGGAGDVSLMTTMDGELVTVVEDVRGQHFDLPTTSPSQRQLGGRGLWIVTQICDRVAVRRGPRGTQLLMAVFSR